MSTLKVTQPTPMGTFTYEATNHEEDAEGKRITWLVRLTSSSMPGESWLRVAGSGKNAEVSYLDMEGGRIVADPAGTTARNALRAVAEYEKARPGA